jgi:myosin-1
MLEEERSQVVVTLAVFLQKLWRGTLQRIRYKKMRALLKIMEYYRKYKLRSYINDLERRFKHVRQMEDRGKSISWGIPPKAIVPTVQFFKLVFRRWRAHYVISQLPIEHHPAVQLRCNIFDTFAGNRQGWQYGNWNGDYMTDDPNYNLSVNKLRTSGDGIGRVIFASQGLKLSSGAKSNERIVLITDRYLIKIDPNKKYKVLDKKPLSETVIGCSVFSNENSQIVVIHCANRNDLVMVLSKGYAVECIARLSMLTGVKPNLSRQIDIKVDKKKTILTREASMDQTVCYQKRGATIAALE